MASVIRSEKERDDVNLEAKATRLVATSTEDAKDRVEVDLTKDLNSLAAVEEGERRSKAVRSPA